MSIQAAEDQGPAALELGLGRDVVGSHDLADLGGRPVEHANLGVRNHREVLFADIIQEEDDLCDIGGDASQVHGDGLVVEAIVASRIAGPVVSRVPKSATRGGQFTRGRPKRERIATL